MEAARIISKSIKSYDAYENLLGSVRARAERGATQRANF